MTHPPDNLTATELPLGMLEANWNAIASVASQIAAEVEIKSEGLSGNFLKQALSVSDFFRSKPSYERALNKPAVLAIVNPLAQQADEGKISKLEIAKAVSSGLCTLSRHGTNHRSLFRIFVYPILLTYFVVFGSILTAHFITPYFESMFAEFGIGVPRMTSAFFQLAYFVRTYTFTILLISLGLPPLLWLLDWIGRENRPPGMSCVDIWLARKRPSTARWLLHFSLLLESGIPKADAIRKASLCSSKGWIRSRSNTWLRKSQGDYADSNLRLFNGRKLRMADAAIEAPRSRGQVVLLQQVATWYRDSSSSMIEWWVQLLIPVYVFLILISVAVLLISLLMPFFAVFSGLTGGPGGIM